MKDFTLMNFEDWRWQFYKEQHDVTVTQQCLFPDFVWRPLPPNHTREHYENDA